MLKNLWALGVLGLSSQGFSLKGFIGGLLSNDKSRTLNSEQPPIYGGGGWLFIARVTRHDMSGMTLGQWTTDMCPTVGFQTHMTAWLGLQVELTHPTQDKIFSHGLHLNT
jgi:hypothetical protein